MISFFLLVWPYQHNKDHLRIVLKRKHLNLTERTNNKKHFLRWFLCVCQSLLNFLRIFHSVTLHWFALSGKTLFLFLKWSVFTHSIVFFGMFNKCLFPPFSPLISHYDHQKCEEETDSFNYSKFNDGWVELFPFQSSNRNREKKRNREKEKQMPFRRSERIISFYLPLKSIQRARDSDNTRCV